MKPKTPVVTNHRSSVTGQFVTKQYVKTHPSTTTTEHNPVRSTPNKPPSKR